MKLPNVPIQKADECGNALYLRHIEDLFAGAAIEPGRPGRNETHVSSALPTLTHHFACKVIVLLIMPGLNMQSIGVAEAETVRSSK